MTEIKITVVEEENNQPSTVTVRRLGGASLPKDYGSGNWDPDAGGYNDPGSDRAIAANNGAEIDGGF
ncbi:hypothetical protein KC878_00965 [Candidatus Saccharibacteria bacterium]|nr:hypothetical protein [Candidatus Saccharibacteria bacterium]MCB9821176.1 hypothetical protein [Candidatus Nomurabacteria bacterium]